ncbi:MAG TPA: NfeD family protein [Desulfobacterales bacterium]|nr:NfeD family protein [Desulfobacterales bacterium]
MNGHRKSVPVIIKYILFQVPGFILFVVILFLLDRWLDIPGWIVGLLIFAWVAKDAILFPFVRKAYEVNREEDGTPMRGLKGFAKERLSPSGYVQVRGELWKAKASDETRPIEKGECIKVYSIRGLTLIVAPENEEGSNRDLS